MKRWWWRTVPLFLLVLFAVVYLGAGAWLANGKVLGERHQDIGDDAFDFTDSASFNDYVDQTTTHLRRLHPEAGGEVVADNLAPFIMVPDSTCPRAADGRWQKGIVLTHGLLESPYSMRLFGEDLRARCFLVFGLLLPDHATRPGDMLDTRWENWVEAMHFATSQMAQQSDSVFLSGHSVGGALSVLEAGRNNAVDGLVLFAPALAISGAARFASFITPLGRLFPGAAWLTVAPDQAVYRYESFSFSGVAETWALIKAVQAGLNERTRSLPIFTVVSMEDTTVVTDATLAFMADNSNPASETVLYSQHQADAAERVSVINSNAPQTGVLSTSHLGVMIPSGHPWFGRNGSYRNCGHYPEAAVEFVRCKAGSRDYYGEITGENLAAGLVERIAFNPWYEEMLGSLDAFLSSVYAP
jgi:esterase/lipase